MSPLTDPQWDFAAEQLGGWTPELREEKRQAGKREAKAEMDQRRRERLRNNGPREPYTNEVIGDRDGWICGICQDRVDRRYVSPDPASPSVDHIVPVELGGPDTLDNVRITHLFCNMDRADAPAHTVPVVTVRLPDGRTASLGGDLPARAGHTPEEARARLAAKIAGLQARNTATGT